MRVSHRPERVSAVFDDPNLVSCAGLAPVVALAERCGLAELVAERVTLPATGGVKAHLKVPALVAGMVAGADSIDDMGLLRHGGMDRLFGGVRAPSTLGTFLRTFTFGHVIIGGTLLHTRVAARCRAGGLLGVAVGRLHGVINIDVRKTWAAPTSSGVRRASSASTAAAG